LADTTHTEQLEMTIDELQAKIEAADTVAACLQEAVDELVNFGASVTMIADFERALFNYDHVLETPPYKQRTELPTDFDVVAR
jgi:hypothetical protein